MSVGKGAEYEIALAQALYANAFNINQEGLIEPTYLFLKAAVPLCPLIRVCVKFAFATHWYLLKMGFDLFHNKLLHRYDILALRDNLREFLLAGSLDPFIDNITSLGCNVVTPAL